MLHEQKQCDRAAASRFLADQLSADEQATFEEHLESCTQCREQLDAIAAEKALWDEVRETLGSSASLRIRPDAAISLGLTSADEGVEARSCEAVLSLLKPTDHPNMLGRFGGYEIVGIIGRGGMGVVLKGFDPSLHRFVAIKVLAPHLAASGAARKRFSREAQAAAAVVHDNVIAIHSVSEVDDHPYLVMPYERGRSLQKRLDEGGSLGVAEVLRIGMQAAAGLSAAHAQGLVHRDVKPANILLDDGVERVKLTDFGLARAADDASLTKTGVIAGTPQFMSPEQARGDALDARSDLFCLGSVMYTMCTGRPPFRAETSYGVLRRITDTVPRAIREINPDIPQWLCEIIAKLMSKQPQDRPASAEKVALLLEDCLAHVQQPDIVPLPNELISPQRAGTKGPSSLFRRAALAITGVIVFLAAAVVVVLELNKGTLTIESAQADVPIRIMKGDTVYERLTVSALDHSIRIAAGQYTVEIDGQHDGLHVENNRVTVIRGDEHLVSITLKDPRSTEGSNHEGLADQLQRSNEELSARDQAIATDAVFSPESLVTLTFTGASKDVSVNSFGIGLVVDDHGSILTLAHLVPEHEQEELAVRYASGKTTLARRINSLGHFALFEPIDPEQVSPISLAEDVALADGDPVSGILNSTDSEHGKVVTARKTVVISEGPGWNVVPPLRFYNAIVTDLKTDQATHGGAPLLTHDGRLAGMLIQVREGELIALPLSEMRMAVEQMMRTDDQETPDPTKPPASWAIPELQRKRDDLLRGVKIWEEALQMAEDAVERRGEHKELYAENLPLLRQKLAQHRKDLAEIDDRLALFERGLSESSAGAKDIVPRWERWDIRFPDNQLQFSRVLDHFEIEMGVIKPQELRTKSNELIYLCRFSATPQIRHGTGRDERRLYFASMRDSQRNLCRAVAAKAGIDTSDCLVLLLCPKELESTLADLELEFADGKPLPLVKRTVFGVRPKGSGHELYVISQEYSEGSSLNDSLPDSLVDAAASWDSAADEFRTLGKEIRRFKARLDHPWDDVSTSTQGSNELTPASVEEPESKEHVP